MNLLRKSCILMLSIFMPQALALPTYLGNFTNHYGSNGVETSQLTADESCALCHVSPRGGGRRNAYGEDFKKITLGQRAGFPGIEFLDSDGDGFSNLEEIYLQTSPGNAQSAPAGRIEVLLDTAAAQLVISAASCANLQLKAFGFVFQDGAAVAKVNAVQGEVKVSVTGTQGTVLAQCTDEKLVGSLTIAP